MGCNVFANGNEISCKASDHKVIADMPDVCMSPPPPPAGPVPIPYPDTSFSKDMQSGSKTVKIKDQEVMLKDQSFYKTSPLGDEAATNSFGANVVSHVITGKTIFMAWSMDVKFEGENVDRHLDLVTSNNASPVTTVAPGGSMSNKTPAEKAKEGHQREVNPDKCPDPDSHKWTCNARACAKCWQPKECQENADKQNEEYKETQAGEPQEKVDKQNADLDKKIAHNKVKDPKNKGPEQEKAAIAKTHPKEKIEHLAYYAHCEKCHLQQEVDMVTDAALVEVKKNPNDMKLKKMTLYQTINEQCFGGKKKLRSVVPTPADEANLKTRIAASPEWGAFQAAKGPVEVVDP